MPCNLTITSVNGIRNTCSGNLVRIEVTGTVSQCNSLTVLIDCIPGTGSPISVPATISGGNYTAIFTAANLANLPCGCGDDIAVEVKCDDPGSNCSQKLNLTLNCVDDNCDCVLIYATPGNCNPDGTRSFTLTAVHTNSNYNPSGTVVDYGDGNQSQPFVFNPNTPYNFSHDYLPGTYSVTLNRPGCPPEQIQITVDPCNPCQTIFISNTVDNDCDAQGRRNATLLAQISSGWPPTPGTWDFGDGSTPQNILLDSNNNWTELTNHNYAAGNTYTATLTLQNCPPETMTIVVPECPSCCPDIQGIDVQVLGCNSDCEREVRITTNFESPAGGCNDAVMEWQYFGSNGSLIATSTTFTTGGSSPFVDTQFFPSSVSPVQAVLRVFSPNGCIDEIRNIVIPPCTTPAGCPQWGTPVIEHIVRDCVQRGNLCCRKVEIRINGDFDIGCDTNGPPPRIRIEYGDGNYDERDIQFSGPQQVVFENEYCQAGTYQVQVSMVNPSGCPEPPPYSINVPACDDADCDSPPDPPEPPKPFCPCCIWLLLLNLTYFVLWAFGLYQGSFDVLGVTVEWVGQGVASLLYGFLVWVIIRFCYQRNPDCNPCWECRVFKCMFYSLLISAIVVVILFILSLIFPAIQVPLWVPAALTAISLSIVFFGFFRSQRCRRFFDTGDCS